MTFLISAALPLSALHIRPYDTEVQLSQLFAVMNTASLRKSAHKVSQ